jgi:hypothetical protein
MQKQQALHCNAEAGGTTQLCRINRRYTVMQEQQAPQINAEEASLHCNAEAAGATR